MATSSTSEEKMQFINGSNTNNFSDIEGEIMTAQTNTNPKPPVRAPASFMEKLSHSINMGFEENKQQSQPRPDFIQSTLDEPVNVTIMRDLKAVGYKFGHVFFPKKSNLLLRDWDLWGPLSLCVTLSVTLQGDSQQNANAPEFASIFALIALGAIVVTLNTKLLSGKISFFQSICVLGYCLLPLVAVSIVNDLILFISGTGSIFSFLIRFLLVVVSCIWSVFASTAFLAADTINLTERKALAIYPIFLFYFVISWLIILDSN